MDVLLLPGYYITESDNILILYPDDKDGSRFMETNNDGSMNEWIKTKLKFSELVRVNAVLDFEYMGPL